ncbi:MAG: thioredoxin 1 [Hyphomonadaceae bacterium]|nr:MAG: thioredoxin 1 [Hyphomonadaceae bacterium]KAF0186995.1 MAG: thioredoxin 1 [Hyphomonadaceae bacterium]
MATINVSDDSFETDVISSNKPVLVDFWASWCGPCKMIAPSLEELSDEMAGSITIAKINIDDNQMTPTKFGVRGIPTMMIFKDGKVVSTQVGAMAKSRIDSWIKEVVG